MNDRRPLRVRLAQLGSTRERRSGLDLNLTLARTRIRMKVLEFLLGFFAFSLSAAFAISDASKWIPPTVFVLIALGFLGFDVIAGSKRCDGDRGDTVVVILGLLLAFGAVVLAFGRYALGTTLVALAWTVLQVLLYSPGRHPEAEIRPARDLTRVHDSTLCSSGCDSRIEYLGPQRGFVNPLSGCPTKRAKERGIRPAASCDSVN